MRSNVHAVSPRIAARDSDATGCGLLFLAYLHDGLCQSWPAIVQTGGPTLAVTYATLTGADAGHAYPAFMQALAPLIDRAGGLVLPAHGNPWRAERPADLPRTDPWGAECCGLNSTRQAAQPSRTVDQARLVGPSHAGGCV